MDICWHKGVHWATQAKSKIFKLYISSKILVSHTVLHFYKCYYTLPQIQQLKTT